MPDLLPLFPLDVVLFPGTPMPLHVFEPRYKEMIAECLESKQPFGILRLKDSGVADVGCTAEILEVTKRYDDGRLDILTEGRQRFELLEVNEERSFLRGDVIYFDDDADSAPVEKRTRAVELYSAIMKLMGGEGDPPEPDTPQLSFELVAPLPLDLDFKQNLLAMRSEGQRIVSIVEYYEALLPRVKRTIHARQKAGGNGHVT